MNVDTAGVNGNRILNALPASEKLQVFSLETAVTLPAETVLFEAGGTMNGVYFPTDGVVSLVTPLRDGSYIEVAAVGNEGIVGIPLVSPAGSSVRAISRMAGYGHHVDTQVFLEWCGRSRALQTLIDRFTQALFCQISQTAACNRFHVSEERLSRWLLTNQDRCHSDRTHDHPGVARGNAWHSAFDDFRFSALSTARGADPLRPRPGHDRRSTGTRST